MTKVKVSAHGRVTIPMTLRRKFGITSGTHIAIEVDQDNQHIVLTLIIREYIHRLRGKYQGKGLLMALMAEWIRLVKMSIIAVDLQSSIHFRDEFI